MRGRRSKKGAEVAVVGVSTLSSLPLLHLCSLLLLPSSLPSSTTTTTTATGDEWDCLTVPKPDNIKDPSATEATKNRRSSYDEFVSSSQELHKMANDINHHSHGEE